MTLSNQLQKISQLTETGITFIRSKNEETFISYRQLYKSSLCVLNELQSRGIKPRDELVFQIKDNEMFLYMFWACILGGIIPVPVTFATNDEQRMKVYRIWEQLKCPYLAIGEEDFQLLASCIKENGEEKSTLVEEDHRIINIVSINTSAVEGTHSNAIYPAKSTDIAFIQFSSGSTGDPKGVVLTHENLVVNCNAIREGISLQPDDVVLSWMPLTHDMGLIGFHLSTLLHGVQQMIMPPTLFIRRPMLWWEKISEHRATITGTPNFGCQHFLSNFNTEAASQWDLSSVRYILNGAEPISAATCNAFLDKLAPYGLKRSAMFTVYGMAEASLAVCFPPKEEVFKTTHLNRGCLGMGDTVLESDVWTDQTVTFVDVGYPVKDCYVRICDANDQVVEDRVIGMIQIQGDNVTPGYYMNPLTTYNAMTADGWLRTGDLGFMRDGRLVITGRVKDVVFLHGQNYYLHDVERVAADILSVSEDKVAACAMQENGDAHGIALFVVFKKHAEQFYPLKEKLISALNQKIGITLMEVLPISNIPKTTSGKKQRFKLSQALQSGSYQEVAASLQVIAQKHKQVVAARNEVEMQLVHMWQEVLAVEAISIRDSFFALGGQSLKATILAARIHQELQVELPLHQLFATPTIEGISEYINRHGKHKTFATIPRAEEREVYPASAAQKGMLLLEQVHPLAEYHITEALIVEGDLDIVQFESALQQLIARHESLRTSFEWIEDMPVQRIHPQVDFKMEVIEVEPSQVDQWIREFVRPFDLSKPPLLRVALLKVKRHQPVLLFDIHHIISDGISMGIFARELMAFYEGRSLPKLPIQYKDYAAWNAEAAQLEALKEHQAYWMDQFSDEVPVLQLPTDRPRPLEFNNEGQNIEFVLDEKLTDTIQRTAMETGTTVFMILLSVYYALLWKYTGQEDIVVGTPISGRLHADINPVMGMFVNTLAIRNEPNGAKSFRSFLEEVKSRTLSAYEHQAYPFEALVEALPNVNRDLGRNPLFDTMFILQNMGRPTLENEAIRFIPYTFDRGTSKFDLTFTAIEEHQKIFFNVEFSTALFDQSTIERMICHYVQLVEQAVAQPDHAMGQWDMISDEEKRQIIGEFNAPVASSVPNVAFHRLFEEQAATTPDHLAVVFEYHSLTYRELNERANQLANVLRTRGIKRGSLVGIMVDRSIHMVVSVLSVLKAGGAYVPIDPDYPIMRIRHMLADSEVKLVLTERSMDPMLQSVYSGEILFADEAAQLSDNTSNLPNEVEPGDLAYIIYTSGTTGKSKGVMIEHRNFVSTSMAYREVYRLMNFPLRAAQLASFSFDVFAGDLARVLLNGGTLFICEREIRMDPEAFIQFVQQHRITFFESTPAFVVPFMELVDKQNADISSLELLITSSDRCTVQDYRRMQERFGERLRIVNSYGVTEAAIDSSVYDEPLSKLPENGNVPIGKPIQHHRLYVMDAFGHVLPVGVSGELCIGGAGVARGYWNRPDLSAEKFVDDPFYPGETMYRTGDQAKWLPDGNVAYLGRADDQVKVRGYRIELGEVETALLQIEPIHEAVIVAIADENEHHVLCAYFTAAKPLVVNELRSALAQSLPRYMLPSYFVQLDALPLTPNGKIDRKALPKPEGRLQTGIEYEAPRTETEVMLANLWQEVLGIEQAGIYDNFFDLGGHSLKATTLVNRIYKEMHTVLPLKEVFQSPNLEHMAKVIEQLGEQRYTAIPQAEQRAYYPLSSAQKRLYILNQIESAGLSYNMPGAMMLEGALDRDRFEAAFREMIARHETLRTSFEMQDGEPVQRIHDQVEFAVEYVQANELEVETLVREFVREFKLDRAPLIRVGLVEITDQAGQALADAPMQRSGSQAVRYLLLFDMHHIISDGMSVTILVEEFASLYAVQTVDPLILQYMDFAVWQQSEAERERIKTQEAYWLKELAGELPVLELPADYPRPAVQSHIGDRVSFGISKQQSQALKALAKQHEVSLYMTLLAAYTTLLHKYAGQDDIIVGTPIAGRSHADTQSLIGMFVNTLAIRSYPSGDKTFRDYLQEIKRIALSAFAHQDYPFEDLVEQVSPNRDLSRHPLFDTMFVMQHNVSIEQSLGNITIKPVEASHHFAKFDLTLSAMEQDRTIAFEIEYATSLFTRETIERISVHFMQLLDAIITLPEAKLADLEIMTPLEKRQLLKEFNHTIADYPSNHTIHQLFEAQAVQTPDHIAAVDEKEQLTYRELNERANRLAHTLRAKGISDDRSVAIMSERTVDMLIGIIAVLKAGGAYVPIDPSYPPERIQYMLKDAQAEILLTGNRSNLYLSDLQVTCLDLTDEGSYDENAANLEAASIPEHLVYIIYTSGSTGHPKGVMISHRNLINYVYWAKAMYLDQNTTAFPLYSSLSFDLTATSIFVPLLSGLQVVLYREDTVTAFSRIVEEDRVEILKLTPSHLRLLLASKKPVKRLNTLIVGGELFESALAEEVVNKLGPSVRIFNEYGPTEATIGCMIYRFDPNIVTGYSVPIGKPAFNTQIYILDKAGQPVPMGVAGEIYIAGDGLARGYFHKQELTERSFIAHPFEQGARVYRTGDLARWLPDGTIEYIGRMDSQVKIHGYRIELGEVESRLLHIPEINEAVVIPLDDGQGDKVLCAYYTADTLLQPQMIKSMLQQGLPKYMVPNHLVQLEQLPLTENGKINRKALPVPDDRQLDATEFVAPRTEMEAALATIWQDVLGLKQVGVLDNFFDLGGHSLRAITLVSRIFKEVGAELPLRDVFQFPTIEQMATIIPKRMEHTFESIPAAEEAPYYPVSSAQQRLYVLQQLNGTSANLSYNMPSVFWVEGRLDRARFEESFRKLAARHETLRTGFEMVDGQLIQRIHEVVDVSVSYTEVYEAEVETVIRQFVRPFALNIPPLMRIGLLEIKQDDNPSVSNRQLLLFDMNHIISDGVSMAILVEEFCRLYAGETLLPLRIQYKDVAVWQRSDTYQASIKAQEVYWLDTLSRELPVLDLPTDHPRPAVQSHEGAILNFSIGEQESDKLRDLAKQHGATLYMVLLAVYKTLLHKYSGQTDLIVGTPVAGRTHADTESLIGMFVNTLAIRSYPAGEKTFITYLNEIKEHLLGAYEHQDVPFEGLVEQLPLERDSSRHPLFDVMFVMQNFAQRLDPSRIQIEAFQLSAYEYEHRTAKFDLTLTAVESGPLIECHLEYATALYDRASIERMTKHFLHLIHEITHSPDDILASYELMDNDEKLQLLKPYHAMTATHAQHKTVHEWFEARVKSAPDQIAVVFEGSKLTYWELNTRANQLARTLRSKGVTADQRVGVFCERSLDMIVSLLAVLKSGGAYVPIDPEFPQDRIQYMLEDSGASLLLLPTHLQSYVNFNGEYIFLDDPAVYHEDGSNLTSLSGLNDLAYVIYTSGTTGQPKGTLIEHRNVVQLFVSSEHLFDFDSQDTWTLFHSYCFDFSVWEMYGALLNGGKVVIVPQTTAKDPRQLLQLLHDEQVTILNQTPSYFYTLMSEALLYGAPDIQVRKVIFGGEALNPLLLKPWQEKYPHIQLINMYGITETTVHVTFKEITETDIENGQSNIGQAIPTLQIYILDQQKRLQPVGIPGEMYVAGEGVSRGYLNRPELTEEKFVNLSIAVNERMYRTVDLARWKADGTIEYLGRIDHQVNIRGYRIELGEIESRLLNHAAIQEAIVLSKKDQMNHSTLCAYFTAADEVSISEIREHLRKKLPNYMVPSFFVQLERMPLTPNGKLDLKALPNPDGKHQAEAEYVAPRDEIEQQLVLIWQEVLRFDTSVTPIGVHDHFFDLGGHSLKATALVSHIHRTFNVNLPLIDVFTNPTIEGLARRIREAEASLYAAIPAAENKEYYAVSPAQKRIYVLSQLEGGQVSYNMPGVFLIQGALNKDALEGVFKALIRRHEALRTSFEMMDNGPVQRIHEDVEFKIDNLKLPKAAFEEASKLADRTSSAATAAGITDETALIDALASTHEVRALIQAFIKPFDLSQAPMLRVGLIELSAKAHLLLFDMHHLISDGTTMSLLVRELAALYHGQALPELTIQYKDYSEWQNALYHSEAMQRHKAYWLDTFAGELPVLDLPTDEPRPPVRSFEGDSLSVTINHEQTIKLNQLAADTGSTLYMVLLSAYNILLSKYTGQEDIIVGSPIAGRQHAELEHVIGMFVNTLAIRNYPLGSKTYKDFLEEVKQQALAAYEHQDYPFEDLVEELKLNRDMSRNPLFDTMLVLQNTEKGKLEFGDLTFSACDTGHKISKFDMTLNAVETEEGLTFTLEYCTRLFKQATIKHFMGHYIHILAEIVADPEQRLADIEMLSTAEKHQLLTDFNATEVEYPQDTTIHELFESQAARTPDHIALVFRGQTLTYRELNSKAEQLASLLSRKGIQSNRFVGVLMEHSLEMIIGIMGILKAGGAYVPIDPAYPKERIEYIVEDCRTELLLTQQHLMNLVDIQCETIQLDDPAIYEAGYDQVIDNSQVRSGPHDLVYAVYTSGTTGTPKGVMIEHHALVNLCQWHRRVFEVTEADRATKLAGFGFDASVWEIFPYLTAGASLHILDQSLDVAVLNQYFEQHDITISFLPTPLCEKFMELDNRSLRVLLTGGDRLKVYQTRGYKLVNNYGPTESTVVTTSGIISDERSTYPIGRPIDNHRVYILGLENQLQPIGVAGELCIAGAGLARGYLNEPELTAEKFVDHPFNPGERMYRTGDLVRWLQDGTIEYLGRIDHQVKIRGFRIEPGEIETHLLHHAAVREAVVLAREDQMKHTSLCAYFTASQEISLSEIRDYLRSKLPIYMIPSHFVQLEQLPLTPNGKLDRKALPAPSLQRPIHSEYVPPRDDLEHLLADIWQEVLGIEKIGIMDHFFELGGDSIKGLQMAARLNRAGYKVGIKELFQFPSIAKLSSQVTRLSHMIDQGPVQGEAVLTPIQRWFFEQQFTDQHHWNQAVMLYREQGFDEGILHKVMHAIVTHHDALRMVFKQTESGYVAWNRGVDDGAAYSLEVYSVDKSVSNQEVMAFIDAKSSEIQSSFHLESGPLVKLGIFRTSEGDHLLIAIHHLVIDGVSWRILFEDIATAYGQIQHGQAITLSPKTDAFLTWSQQLEAYSQSESVKQEAEYWQQIEDMMLEQALPKQVVCNTALVKDSDDITITLTEEETSNLLKETNKAYHTEMNDILLTALGLAIAEWTGYEKVTVNLEGHGREEVVERIDISRTIGWFTSAYPVILDLSGKDLSTQIVQVKEHLHRVPNKGIGYGILKYLTSPEVTGLKLVKKPEISFNYLGQIGEEIARHQFEISKYGTGITVGLNNQRTSSLDIIGIIIQNRLNITFNYGRNAFNKETIAHLAGQFKHHLLEIIRHCIQKEKTELTPSDVTYKKMSIDQFKDFQEQMKSARKNRGVRK